jgi:hypothetical protein
MPLIYLALEGPRSAPAHRLTTQFDETNPIFVDHGLSQSLVCPGRAPMAQMGGPASSIVVASIGRQCLPATDGKTTPSILRLATIQGVEGKQDLSLDF